MEPVEIFRGDTWIRVWTITVDSVPMDLTGASARLQVRTKASDEKVWLDLGSSGTDLVIQDPPSSGIIMLKTQTEVLPTGKYVFDLEVTHADGRIKTYEQNDLKIKQDVTR